MSSLVEIAQEILEEYPIYKELPASISGKYHIGETQEEHLNIAFNVMQHLCDEFNVQNEERDLLLASTLLHDIGLYIITAKGKVSIPGWKYYDKTGFSRHHALMSLHPMISASILENYKDRIDRETLDMMKRLVSVHMSHWYPDCPQPYNLFEHLICVADYIASRGTGILEYNGRK